MADPTTHRAIDQAMPSLLVSLAPYGVVDVHRLPDRDGSPVLWLTTATEAQRATLESAAWLPHQVGIILVRLGLTHEAMKALRVLVDSRESLDGLLES